MIYIGRPQGIYSMPQRNNSLKKDKERSVTSWEIFVTSWEIFVTSEEKIFVTSEERCVTSGGIFVSSEP